MKYRGFVITPHYIVGSDFKIVQGAVKPRKQTRKDIEYYDILDPMEGMRKHCAEDTIQECKDTIDALLVVMGMDSNLPKKWAKLN